MNNATNRTRYEVRISSYVDPTASTLEMTYLSYEEADNLAKQLHKEGKPVYVKVIEGK